MSSEDVMVEARKKMREGKRPGEALKEARMELEIPDAQSKRDMLKMAQGKYLYFGHGRRHRFAKIIKSNPDMLSVVVRLKISETGEWVNVPMNLGQKQWWSVVTKVPESEQEG